MEKSETVRGRIPGRPVEGRKVAFWLRLGLACHIENRVGARIPHLLFHAFHAFHSKKSTLFEKY